MSEWAWKKCSKCETRIHIHCMCVCGGDPWNVISEIEKDILNLTNKKEELLKEVYQIDEKINKYNVFLNIQRVK